MHNTTNTTTDTHTPHTPHLTYGERTVLGIKWLHKNCLYLNSHDKVEIDRHTSQLMDGMSIEEATEVYHNLQAIVSTCKILTLGVGVHIATKALGAGKLDK